MKRFSVLVRPRVLPVLAAAALSLLSSTGTAQQAASLRVHPGAISAAPGIEFHDVWVRVPRSSAGPIDVVLAAEPAPALLDLAVIPPVRVAVEPGGLARFRVALRSRPSLAGAEFELVFRERASRTVLGEIPVGVERGVGAGPRAAKEAAAATLAELRDEVAAGKFAVGDRGRVVEELDNAIEELEESLADEFWLRDGDVIDPERLDPERGHHVFERERHSAQDLFDAIRQGRITDAELLEEIMAVVDTLVTADRRLAEVAIADAVDAGREGEDVDRAEQHLADGDARVEEAAEETDLQEKAALLYEAMHNDYRDAWEAAIDAVED